ncbi:unnamed protein product [Cyprideis torosa]|uniref:Uncharacterized protein n=1 Tax=Cyprideis torosa TaxID=163714 RepID=A0A7R8WED5_9CRUS|nr:unnamed protein product [Cyprideis torosa]CAG0889355.1 unnamed protein product [Cyprideis torosa]
MTISTALAARSGGGDDGQSSQSNARTAPSSLVMTMAIVDSPLVCSRPEWFQKLVKMYFEDLTNLLSPRLVEVSSKAFLNCLKRIITSEAKDLSSLLVSATVLSKKTCAVEIRPEIVEEIVEPKEELSLDDDVEEFAEALEEEDVEESPEDIVDVKFDVPSEEEPKLKRLKIQPISPYQTRSRRLQQEDSKSEVEEIEIPAEDGDEWEIVETEEEEFDLSLFESGGDEETEDIKFVKETEYDEALLTKEAGVKVVLVPRSFACQLCDKRLKDVYSFKRHMMLVHLSARKPCPICGKFLKNSKSLSAHRVRNAFFSVLSAHRVRYHGQMQECPTCEKSFAVGRIYERHVLTHTETPSFQCSECEAKFYTANELNNHINACHGPKFPCLLCGKQFSKSGLRKHLPRHAEDKLTCHSCSLTFSSSYEVALHKREAHNGLPVFPCPMCERKFLTDTKLDRHLAVRHEVPSPSQPVTRYPCSVCGKTFKTARHAKRHSEQVHGTKVTCTLCNYSIPEAGYEAHMKKHEQFPDTTCIECGKTCLNIDQLRQHTRLVHGLKVPCHVCGKEFPPDALRKHMMGHSEANIPCDLCPAMFKHQYALNEHKRKRHTEHPEILCPTCGKKFYQARNLKVHMKYHQEPKFPCGLCDKVFFRKCNYNQHLRQAHEGMRPWRCEPCARGFYTKVALEKHQKLTHGNGNLVLTKKPIHHVSRLRQGSTAIAEEASEEPKELAHEDGLAASCVDSSPK